MLGLKEKHKIPQAVLQEILHGVTNLTQIRLNSFRCMHVTICMANYVNINLSCVYIGNASGK